MRVHRELWLHTGEDSTCLLGCGVVPDDGLEPFRTNERILRPKCVWVDDFVNQNIGPLGKMNQILREAGVAREHHGMAAEVDAVAQSRLDPAMVYCKRGYLDPSVVIDDTLLDVL